MDELENFASWFLNNVPVIGHVPFDRCCWQVDGAISVVLHRQPPFQVQLWVILPREGGYVIPEHTHPNVDSIEVYVGGDIRFSHSGAFLYDAVERDVYGMAGLRGHAIRVRPTDLHGGVIGPGGGVFLSIQHWLNDVDPHDVAMDYVGAVMGPQHMAGVVDGDAVLLDRPLTAADAACKENTC